MLVLITLLQVFIVTTMNEYNDTPVLYCKSCLSLLIRNALNRGTSDEVDELDYCDKCNSTSIGICSIAEWEAMYVARFGHKYLDK